MTTDPTRDEKREGLQASATQTEQEPGADRADANDNDLQDEIAQFDQLIDQHLPPETAQKTARGEVLEVPVVAVREDHVLVDIGGKAEATIRLDEFPMVGGVRAVAVGDVIKAVQLGRETDGTPRLSHREARAREAEESVRLAHENQTPVKGRVVQTVKGGLIVDIGLTAFMPASQVDLFKIPDLTKLAEQDIEAYVIEYDDRRKRAVLSRRKLLFEKRESERRAFLDGISEGAVISGTVKNALDFGVFVDLGAIDGFVPREEVSYDRGTHPGEIMKAGEEVSLKIVRIDEESGKVTLSRKRMQPDPWDTIGERFSVNALVKGRVIALQHYGAFVYVEEGVTGMIHAGDLSWQAGNKKPADFLTVGDEVECKVLELDAEKRRMSLGLKQVQMDPWADAATKYARNAKVKGSVTSMTNYGAFIRLDEYIEGMVHVSDLSWEKRINHPKDVLKVGEEVEAVVLKCDPQAQRISLGVKQITDSPFDAYTAKHPVGSVVTGKVTRFAPFGAFVELAEGLEGLVHISQIDEKRVELPEKVLTQGEEITVKITKIEKKNQKISLSRREAIRAQERQTVNEFMKQTDAHGGMTFGEALKNARKDTDG